QRVAAEVPQRLPRERGRDQRSPYRSWRDAIDRDATFGCQWCHRSRQGLDRALGGGIVHQVAAAPAGGYRGSIDDAAAPCQAWQGRSRQVEASEYIGAEGRVQLLIADQVELLGGMLF